MTISEQRSAMSLGSLHQVGGEGLTDPRDSSSWVIWPEGFDHAVMIDCGSRFGYEQLKRRLGKLGLSVENIKYVFATHGDIDHWSGYLPMSKESDVQLFVPTKDIDAVESGDSILTAAVHYGVEAEPCKVSSEVSKGFCFQIGNITIKAVEAPGHTPGSVCYEIEEDGKRTLLTGDALFSFFFLNRSKDIEQDVHTARESVRRLAERRPDRIGFGHAVLGLRDDATLRVREAWRQCAPFGVSMLVEKARNESKTYIEPFYKVFGQYYRY